MRHQRKKLGIALQPRLVAAKFRRIAIRAQPCLHPGGFDSHGEGLVEGGIVIDINALVGQFMKHQAREIGFILAQHGRQQRIT